MFKNRFSKLVIVSALIVAAIIVLMAFEPPAGATRSSRSDVGMGDLQRFEGYRFIPAAEAEKSRESNAGIGDLRVFEASKYSGSSIGLEGAMLYAGMGDLHLLESRQRIKQDGSDGLPNCSGVILTK